MLEAYLGVTLKRLFSTGPDAFAEIRGRLEQFAQSLAATESYEAAVNATSEQSSRGTGATPHTLRLSVIETLTSLSLAIDAKDQYTQGHSTKVANYAAVIAERLALSEEQIEEIQLGGLLHDIGKVGIPESILSKNGPLDPEEWDVMKQHVNFGEQLLQPLRAISRVREMVLHHHEMFDGSGYPSGLKGEKIPIGARIICRRRRVRHDYFGTHLQKSADAGGGLRRNHAMRRFAIRSGDRACVSGSSGRSSVLRCRILPAGSSSRGPGLTRAVVSFSPLLFCNIRSAKLVLLGWRM